MKKFNKPALSFSAQIAKLAERGLVITDQRVVEQFLRKVSYFRLSGYTRPFYQPTDAVGGNHRFKDGTTFDDIVSLYEFDRELRLLTFSAIDRIEIAFRTAAMNHLCIGYGTHWFERPELFYDGFPHGAFLKELELSFAANPVTGARSEDFLDHYFKAYGDPSSPPGWMIAEILSLGTWSKVYNNLTSIRDRKAIAAELGWSHVLVESWIHMLTILRNLCAHHGRIWNRTYSIRPKMPAKDPLFDGLTWNDQSFAAQAIVVHALLSKSYPDAYWPRQLAELLSRYPKVKIGVMGFTIHWKKQKFWGIDPPLDSGL